MRIRRFGPSTEFERRRYCTGRNRQSSSRWRLFRGRRELHNVPSDEPPSVLIGWHIMKLPTSSEEPPATAGLSVSPRAVPAPFELRGRPEASYSHQRESSLAQRR